MDSTLVIYTGLPLPYISVAPGDDLQTILGSIDTAVNAVTGAPSYTPFNLQCLRPTYTINNTQQYAEAVADFICLLRDDYDTFTSTTYVADMAAIQATLDDLTDPGLTYSPFGIINTDDLPTVYSKLFAGLTNMQGNTDPSLADWAAIGVGTPPTTTSAAFDEVITYGLALLSALAGKEDSIGTFDNSANCLVDYGGGATDSPRSTIEFLTSLVCTLPTFDDANLVFGCVSPQTSLEKTLNAIMASLSNTNTRYVNKGQNGIKVTASSSCNGYYAEIDDTWPDHYLTAVSLADASAGDTGYLEDLIYSSDGSITVTGSGGLLDITITTPLEGKVKVNANDPTADYLAAKIPSTVGTWGLGINSQARVDNGALMLTPTVYNADMLINGILDAIQDDPELLAKFCATVEMCGGCLCGAVVDLIVTANLPDFTLDWTAVGGNTTTQVAKYRQAGDISWLTGNFNPANLLAAAAVTTDTVGLANNTLYDFQIDTNCPGDVGKGNIAQGISYDQQVVTITDTVGVVKVNQNPLPTVSVIDYRLLDNNLQPLQNVAATGINPIATFTAVSSGNYNLEFRYGTLVNGVMLYSDDASQATAWYLQGPFAVA